MQTFSTDDARHKFVVDGREYYLPGVTLYDAMQFAELDGLTPTEQVDAFKAILLEKVRVSKLGRWERLRKLNPGVKAVSSLSVRQTSELFKEWAGANGAVVPGESSRSDS